MSSPLPLATPPLATRLSVARSVALVLLGYGLFSLLLALVDGVTQPLGPVLLSVAPSVLACGFVAAGGLQRLRDDRRQEVALALFATAIALSPLTAIAVHTEFGSTPLLVLPLLLLASGLLTDVRVHLVLTLVAGLATTALAGRVEGPLADATDAAPYLLALVTVTVGVLTAVASSALAHALRAAERGRARSTRSNEALRSVVMAASAATDVATDLPELLDVVATAMGGIGAHVGGVVLIDEDGTHLRYGATYRIPADVAEGRFPLDQGVAGEVLRTGRPVVVGDYATSAFALPRFRDAEVRVVAGIPVRDDEGLVGVLLAARFDDDLPEAGALSALQLLADFTGRAIALSRRIGDEQRTLRRLERLNERQRDFVATVSHELRTPVTIVDGLATTLLAHGPALDEAGRTVLLERIAANSASLVSIVTTLLDAARLDTGLVLDEEQVDLGRLVERAVTRMAPVLAEHDVRVDVVAGALVRGDDALLQRVVDNLLTNVERHTPASTPVSVSVRIAHGQAVVEVADRGPGIPPEVLPRITSRFVRGGDHRTRPTRGLGIGLALADQVLRLHGSRLELSSTEGGGATFAFALLLARRRQPRDEAAAGGAPTGNER